VEPSAGGGYCRAVDADRRDEIGRLSMAFNTMADRVANAHRELEDRVDQRTRKLAEAGAELETRVAELTELRTELDRFFLLSLDMLCIADTTGQFKRVNPVWQDALGWTPEELTSRPYFAFIHPDDLASTMRESARLADGASLVSFENRYQCKDGSYRWLSWKAAPVPEHGLIYATA